MWVARHIRRGPDLPTVRAAGLLGVEAAAFPRPDGRPSCSGRIPSGPVVPQLRGGTMAAKKSTRKGSRKYGKAASKSVKSAMRRRKKGTLTRGKAGRGGKVKSRKQAV